MKKKHTVTIDEALLWQCMQIVGKKNAKEIGQVIDLALAEMVRREESLKRFDALEGSITYDRQAAGFN